MVVDGFNSTKISARFGSISITFDISGGIRWNPKDLSEGPEGWVSILPIIGLHWFVHSLASSAKVSFSDIESGLHENAEGFAHMEKNWGVSFPNQWIWVEGMSSFSSIHEKPDVTLAFAGGDADVAGISIPNQFLVGYRSALLDWNFHPQDPAFFSIESDACNGKIKLTARTATRKLEVEISASFDTFESVWGPTSQGFIVDSVESFAATAFVRAYEMNPLLPLLPGSLLEETTLTSVAIEFGGKLRCQRNTDVSSFVGAASYLNGVLSNLWR